MHDRLLPLNPPSMAFAGSFSPGGLHHITLLTMPWMEVGLFAVMLVMFVRFAT